MKKLIRIVHIGILTDKNYNIAPRAYATAAKKAPTRQEIH